MAPVNTQIALMPFGSMQGTACLAVPLEPGADPDQVASQLAVEATRPGIQSILITSAPWGDSGIDAVLLRIMADAKLHVLPVIAVMPVDAEHWSGTEITWIGDATCLVREPTNAEVIRGVALTLPYRPRFTEIIVRHPPAENLQPTVLDEIYSILDPEGIAWIHAPGVSDEYRETARNMLSRCSTPWGIRI